MRAPNGAGCVRANGYRYFNRNGKQIAEHRIVMEGHLGRPLEPYETVHHLNGWRADNRLENLELWTKPQVAGQRVDDLVAFVVEHYPEAVKSALKGREA